MPLSILRVPPLTHQFTLLKDDRTHERIRLNPAPTPPGELEGMGHRLLLGHRPLEAQSQAEAGEELSLGRVEILEVARQVLVFPGLVTNLTGQP